MRKLCSIQRVSSIEPIEGADRIELAKVLGWQTVVKKGEFKPGDLVIYCEIDSVMPNTFEFSWLKSRRIKTMRLRGCLSQGLCLPLTYLPNYVEAEEGLDVTEYLDVTQYNSDKVISNPDAKGEWPSFLTKSGATRLQSCKTNIVGEQGYITEKLDGTSATYYIYQGEFGVCSRNLELKATGTSVYHFCANKYNLKNRLQWHGGNVAIQGEIVGPNIQSNRYGLHEAEFYVYAAYELDTGKKRNDVILGSGTGYLGIPFVPVIHIGCIPDSLYEMCHMQSKLNPDVLAEGIVVRLFGHNTLYKVINPEYLLKHGL